MLTISNVDSLEAKLNQAQDDLGIPHYGRVSITYRSNQDTRYMCVCVCVCTCKSRLVMLTRCVSDKSRFERSLCMCIVHSVFLPGLIDFRG